MRKIKTLGILIIFIQSFIILLIYSNLFADDNISTINDKIIEKMDIAIPLIDSLNESKIGASEWQINLHDDNYNTSLSPRFRTWYYSKLDDVDTSNITIVKINGDGFRPQKIVVPLYSYNNIDWHRFNLDEIVPVSEGKGFYNYNLKKKFESKTVWIARNYPYQYSRLLNLLNHYKNNSMVKIEEIGKTSRGVSIPMITITNFNSSDKNKKRIWIHARTHASETGGSFVVEGLIDFLLSDSNLIDKTVDLNKLIFHIVPMVNIDGVIADNARVTPDSSYDLERMWFMRKDNHYLLEDSCPSEVKAMHDAIARLDNGEHKFIAAFNLHSKNAPYQWRHFMYSNFKRNSKVYGSIGDTVFFKHLTFAKMLTSNYCKDTICVRPGYELYKSLDEKLFPEGWWWANFKQEVMAVTIESVLGNNGCYEEWMTYKDQMNLGRSLGISIQQYYNYFIENKWEANDNKQIIFDELMKYYKFSEKDY